MLLRNVAQVTFGMKQITDQIFLSELAQNKYEWTSEDMLFQPRKDVNTQVQVHWF